jgi:dipeptidyl aminopeptidase/acylaminoacyl peptidase
MAPFAALLAAGAVFASLGAGAVWADDAAAFPANEDLRHMHALADPRLSPDGKQVLIQIADTTADGGRTHLWLVDVARNASRQLTWSPTADKRGEFRGRWLGNGATILFLAKRGERMQLFRLPMNGGEAHAYEPSVAPPVDASAAADAIPPQKKSESAVTPDLLPLEIDDFEAAPDGRSIAIVARDPETPGEKKQKEEKADAVAVDRDLHRKRVYLMDPDSGKLTSIALEGDVKGVSWSAQSDRLIVIAEGPNNAGDLGPDTAAWLVRLAAQPLADPGHAARISALPPTIDDGRWSDDGSRFFYRAQAARDAPPGYGDLFSLNMSTRAISNLTADFTGSVDGSRPIAVGNDVIEGVELGVRRTYVRIHEDKIVPLAIENQATQLDSDAKHTAWVWLAQSGAQPPALFYAKQLGREARVLATPALLPRAWPPAVAQIVHWSNEGLNLEGLLFLPPQSFGGKLPLIVDVHGGPTGVWSDNFSPLTQFLLGHGWAVFRPNPRGSSGYGAVFAAANKNDLGGGDYRDIMTGVDTVLARFPIDADKLILMGYSYGGEMAAFVEGKTDRFKGIISGAPVIDQQSEYGTEGDSWYDRWFYGRPWENAEAAWRQSPLAHVAHAKSPFLLIQGEADSTDPLGQSQEMYRALRQAGVRVEMVQYPREDHGPLARGYSGFPSEEPWHGFDVRQRLVKFIDGVLAR